MGRKLKGLLITATIRRVPAPGRT